jgi:tRNA(Ile)-lysidine synthase
MEQTVRRYISAHGLLQKGKPCLVALSGGADSVALLRVLLSLGYPVAAAHCNFHLRGEESDRDERFCVELAQRLGVKLHLAHFDTQAYATLHHQSIELAARNLRYDWFERLRQDVGAQAVCVAHHKDDSVETILLNLLRGTGVAGLTGISPRRGHVIRPLLCVGRQDILNYLSTLGQDYVTDSTNLETKATRNKLRLEIIPMLNTVNPKAAENILRCGARLAELECMCNEVADALVPQKGSGLDVSRLTPANASFVLHRWLSPFGFQPAQVDDVARHLSSGSGLLWQTRSHELLLHRGMLLLEPRRAPLPSMRLPEQGRYVLPLEAAGFGEAGGLSEACSSQSGFVSLYIINVSPPYLPSREPWHATLDAQGVVWPLTLRPWREGDRFQPLGMAGTRLVSDVLTDRHYSLFQKRRQWVLEDGSGQILWLPGVTTAHHCRITPQTRTVLDVLLELPQTIG